MPAHKSPMRGFGDKPEIDYREPAENPPDSGVLKRAIAASAIGNATEWFDYGIYAYGVGLYLGGDFSRRCQGRDAVGARHVRGFVSWSVRSADLVSGPLGDRLGRKHVLAITIVLMAGATFCVGLIPSYASIGMWAPAIMVALRMIQGFSTGGEYGGAATFMAEYAPSRRRGLPRQLSGVRHAWPGSPSAPS